MKYLILENKIILKDVLNYLIQIDGLPKIQRRLNLYASDDSGLEIEIINNKVSYRYLHNGKFIYVKNKNLKHFFKYISKSTQNFIINDIELLKFPNANLLFNTFHGDILVVENDFPIGLKEKFNLKVYENINDHDMLFCLNPEPLFDEMGTLNKKIRDYATKTALDIRSSSSSIKLRLSNLSNDYSHIEKYFYMITNNELLSPNSIQNFKDKFESISIIIPSYNSYVVPTLLSIQGQNISKENKKKIQVIVIDDGSNNSVVKDVECIKQKLDYELNVVTLNKNMGLSNARNVGIALAKYNLILFLDSDIILSKNYIYDINIRLQIIPNAIFVAMRKNISKDSEFTKEYNLLNGIENSFDLDDSRVITKRKEYHIGWNKAFKDDIISILDDSNFFKQLGFGARIGIYDLPAVVAGHNMAINRELINKYPVFSTEFVGWGMEDAYFASTLIASGCFVIPLLSSCVYHIDHPPRSGSMEKKRKEAEINFEKYNQMLDSGWEE